MASILTHTLLNWLLADENPAIKYRALTEISGENPDVHKDCYDEIWKQKQIAKLLSCRNEDGLLATKGKHGLEPMDNLEVFAEFGLHKDARLDKNAQYSLDVIRTWKVKDTDLYACYTPSRLRALVMLGYCDNNVKTLIDEFAATQLSDGGFMCNRLLYKKPYRKSCYKAAVPGLLLYVECKRKNMLPSNADKLVDYFLRREVFYTSDMAENLFFHIDGVSPKFSKFGVPLMVYALSVLGVGDSPKMQKAWKLLYERLNENGRLRLDGSSKQPGVYGKDGQENKWATFYAMLADKYRIAK
ncbi:MAG: hypothetical protein FWB88_01250 [Defluviitaleaceae bacterium]|nr:hypothetical protein [Defluviitaleaceae bacterium]MCL2238424.1 hypothetical protein [Defluviitaleaceae bacterium]